MRSFMVAALIMASSCLIPESGQLDSSFRYAAQPLLHNPTLSAIGRIEESTGIDMSLETFYGPGVTSIKTVHPSDIGGACGLTSIKHQAGLILEVKIDISYPVPMNCFDISGTITHEIIHSLRRHVAIGGQDYHSHSGLFAAYAGDNKLNSDSLESVCEAVDCAIFNPEE
jgi:hypothetical protein